MGHSHKLHFGGVDFKILILIRHSACIFAKSVAYHEGDSEVFQDEPVLTDP